MFFYATTSALCNHGNPSIFSQSFKISAGDVQSTDLMSLDLLFLRGLENAQDVDAQEYSAIKSKIFFSRRNPRNDIKMV
ncbi:hypothetical protein JTE90_026479 [Oedothorax gibbosus]|uniref:Uncharacterized protein n=1 Tax=Oedothorax gibbosus TaxID=931172 RepID=A0AAV6VSU0_9ARAC|nr:hypothetical protein JTE90_026479 [Oedothorax gibbosus]